MSIEKTNVKMNEQLAESKRKDEENGKIKCKLKNDLICLESVLNQYPSVSFGKLGNTILQCSFADERAEPDPEKQYPGDMG